MLLTAATCIKHVGFKEEREWRAIYFPGMFTSSFIRNSIEVISGVPQAVYKLPVDAAVIPGHTEIDFSNLFNRLIIGPTQYPQVMLDAFMEALKASGVPDSQDRVFVSRIPIRS